MKHTVCFLVLVFYADAVGASCKVADFTVQDNFDLKRVSHLLHLSLSLSLVYFGGMGKTKTLYRQWAFMQKNIFRYHGFQKYILPVA